MYCVYNLHQILSDAIRTNNLDHKKISHIQKKTKYDSNLIINKQKKRFITLQTNIINRIGIFIRIVTGMTREKRINIMFYIV